MEIPVLLYDRTVGTHGGSMSREREDPVERGQLYGRKSRHMRRTPEAERKRVAKHAEAVPRKAAIVHTVPVPQTDTGG